MASDQFWLALFNNLKPVSAIYSCRFQAEPLPSGLEPRVFFPASFCSSASFRFAVVAGVWFSRRGSSVFEVGESCGSTSSRQSRCRLLQRVLRLSHVNRPVYTQCCKLGAVVLPVPLRPSAPFMGLFQEAAFLDNIRAYNSMFSMTSFGANIDESVNITRGPYTFKVSGQVSHWIGSLCPPSSEKPRFLQLYIYDTENEVSNRLRFFDNPTQGALDERFVSIIGSTLNATNEYVCTFKSAADIACGMGLETYSVRLYNNVSDRRYGAPSPGTLGAIIAGDDPNSSQYDIVVHSKDGLPHRISKLHPAYMPFQYPLLFPFGEDGWSPRMRSRTNSECSDRNITVNMYYSYQLHARSNMFSLLLCGGRLFQQYIVDAYICVEQNRLDYVQNHQEQLRSEYVSGVYDALSRGDSEGRFIGRRIFLPASFVGGPRYMYKHYQDALAICRIYGNPQYFVTFTCNVKWPEIVRYMDTHGVDHSQNRPDIIARVFQMKVEAFILFLKDDKPFGNVDA
ncbi:hypothetical protein Lser_V15G23940 [Lactuca serriola]